MTHELSVIYRYKCCVPECGQSAETGHFLNGRCEIPKGVPLAPGWTRVLIERENGPHTEHFFCDRHPVP